LIFSLPSIILRSLHAAAASRFSIDYLCRPPADAIFAAAIDISFISLDISPLLAAFACAAAQFCADAAS
jgi:hypothetical protein